jgi:hypothetical protein
MPLRHLSEVLCFNSLHLQLASKKAFDFSPLRLRHAHAPVKL